MTTHSESLYATVMDDSELTGCPVVTEGAGPYGGDEEVAEPLVTGGKKYSDVDQDICAHTEQFPKRRWWIAFGISSSLLGLLVVSLISLFYVGEGIVGINSPVKLLSSPNLSSSPFLATRAWDTE